MNCSSKETADILPAVGTFLKPIGHYCYCLEAAKLTEYKDGKQMSYRRWGWKNNQPFDDGYRGGFHYMDNLIPVLPGFWKEPALGWDKSKYFKEVKGPADKNGQLSLF